MNRPLRGGRPASQPPSLRRVAASATLIGVAGMCLVHALLLGGRLLFDGPQRDDLRGPESYRWVERHVRSEGSVGLEFVDETTYGERTEIRSNLQSAVAPTRVLEGRRAITVLACSPRLERDRFRQRVAELGFPARRLQADGRVAIGSNEPLAPRDHLPAGVSPAPLQRLPLGLLWLFLPALVAAVRWGHWAAGWMLVLCPVTVSAASVLGDTTDHALAVQLAVGAPLLVAAMLLVRAVAGRHERVEPVSPWGLAALGAVGVLIFALIAFARPEGMVDAQSMYNLRARLILVDDAFWAPFIGDEAWYTEHPDYPPFLSYAVAGLWRLTGGVSHLVPIAIGLSFWLGAGLVLSGWLRSRLGRAYGWTGWIAWCACPFLVRTAAEQVCDVPLAALLGCAWIAWSEARRAQLEDRVARAPLALAAILATAAIWTKNEGAALVVVTGAVTAVSAHRIGGVERRLWWQVFALTLPSLALFALFKAKLPPNDLIDRASLHFASMERLGMISTELVETLTWPTIFHGVFVAAVAWVLVIVRDPRAREERGLTAVIGAYFLVLVAVYLTTPHDLRWHIDTSLQRVTAQVYMLAVILLACAVARAREPWIESSQPFGGDDPARLVP